MTIRGGRAGAGNGGNILNDGSLVLFNARVTDGTAAQGGGIATTGTTQIVTSLIDSNTATGTGGGIANFGASVTISDTTIFNNHGSSAAGFVGVGDGGQLYSLTHVTVAFNVGSGSVNPGGMDVSGGTWSAIGSLFVGNVGDTTPSNCGATASSGPGASKTASDAASPRAESSTTGLVQRAERPGRPDTACSPIPATSPAKHFDTACSSAFDQRLASATRRRVRRRRLPAGRSRRRRSPASRSRPPPRHAHADATPTPSPTATPVAGKSVAGNVVTGKVLVKTPGGKFVALDPTKPIPLGSTIDTKDGTIQLTAQQKAGAKPQGAVLRRHLQDHADQGHDRPHPQRGAREVPEEALRARGGQEEAEDAQAVGRRVGLVPHPRPVQRGDRARHALARPGQLRRHADPGR